MMQNFGQFKILEWIGEGGLGEVCRARDTRAGRTVAIRVVPDTITSDSRRRSAFIADARQVAALSHPNIATLYDVGEDDGHVYLAFEFAPGETLTKTVAGRPMNPRTAIDLAVQMA